MAINQAPNTPLIINAPLDFDVDRSLSETQLFMMLEHEVPDVRSFYHVNAKKLEAFLDSGFTDGLKRKFVNRTAIYTRKGFHSHQVIFHFNGHLMISLRKDSAFILSINKTDEDLAPWIQLMLSYRKRKKKPNSIYLVTATINGPDTIALPIAKPKINLQDHYADEFDAKHRLICKSINTNKTGGLYLFHGQPGTGKSTYIRYLIHQIKRKVIFIPPNMAEQLSAPGFTELLIENANSVLVIEDAEDLIVSRNAGQNSGISTLLNLTDGLLGQSLGIQCIATFNTAVSRIDPALMRKGRLLGMYEFKALSVEKAKNLAGKMKIDSARIVGPMTLAELYNLDQEGYVEKNQFIGFRQNG